MKKQSLTSKFVFLHILIYLVVQTGKAQDSIECGSKLFLDQYLIDQPSEAEQLTSFDLAVKSYREQNSIITGAPLPPLAPIYTIPVVVHVFYNSSDVNNPIYNISYAQIQSQINKLNMVFSTGGASGNGAGIKFCLASQPAGFFNTA